MSTESHEKNRQRRLSSSSARTPGFFFRLKQQLPTSGLVESDARARNPMGDFRLSYGRARSADGAH